jgi:hypothetical protein
MRRHPWFALVTLLLATTAGATSLRKLSPEDVDALAARIVEGRCLSARVVDVPGAYFPATEYVFAIDNVVKGEGLEARLRADGGRLVVRQVGGVREDGSQYHVIGMPEYAVGSRYRLALNGESFLGLTSPVGLGQGVRVLGEPTPSAAAGGATP